MNAPLEAETAAFKRELPNLMSQEGKFALVIGDQVVGTFETYADAVQAGYAKVALERPFLVKKITTIEEAAHYSRPLRACRA